MWKCRRRFKLFVGLFVELLDSLKQGTTGSWILMTQLLAPTNSAWVCWLCWLFWCRLAEITRLNTSEFLYHLDELDGNELVFAFSFVSSNNTDVETIEQFFLLHTRYLCDFSGLTIFSQKLWSSKKTFISYFVYLFGFLAFDPRWILWCLPRKEVSPWDCLLITLQRLVIGQFIRKSCFLDRLFACWLLRKLWASSFARSVKFLSLLSEWVGDWWSSSAWDNSPG